MARRSKTARARLLCGSALASVTLWASAASAQDVSEINIPPQSLASALYTFAGQSGHQVMFSPDLTGAKTTAGVAGVTDREQALRQLLVGTGLTYQREDDTFLIVRAADPQSGSAAGDGAEGTVEALIVTAQKREEDIQDVPIAISAFTQEDLTRSQVAGGPDLMTQVPNFTFTKTNFSGYSIQIRGIGTQAISATTDPAVAVAFNNTPFIRNRFFEQEFYDLQRVEVLRGPQGTLYGRNATAGVVNIISAKPAHRFEAKLSVDLSNYNSSRIEGMVNIPLVEEAAALRVAGAWTKREGYVTNSLTGEQTDGRDLWSTRVTLGLDPVDWLNANLVWEHFEENDDRLRTGKQLCHADPGPMEVNGVPVGQYAGAISGLTALYVSQGCQAASLYSPDSFETPNGYALGYYGALGLVGLPVYLSLNPYVSKLQSRDLRSIETHLKPNYEATTDVVELQLNVDINDSLSISSETAFLKDRIFSFSDFNRFSTTPKVFIPGGARVFTPEEYTEPGPRLDVVDIDGVFCDPQLGCTDRLAAGDLSAAKSRQFSQELRLSSNFEGPFNFNLGANFLRYDTEENYYVFINTLTMWEAMIGTGSWESGVTDNSECFTRDFYGPVVSNANTYWSAFGCAYVDPNDVHNLNDQGRNYFLSKNPYHLLSYAAFGEAYYNFSPELKVTAGFRWTVDKKTAPQIPSWLLAGGLNQYIPSTGSYGQPTRKVIELKWEEPTGRIALDWKPNLGFTDETLVYGSYVRGYKAGGANPPPPIPVFATVCPPQCENGGDDSVAHQIVGYYLTHPETFDAEFVNAYEVGTKNTFLDGTVTANLAAFYYDYTGYQISQIVNRSAVNLNFDAEVWGGELEVDWRPLENLRLGFKGGYEQTRMADGSQAIDLMDRTAGKEGWMLFRPFPTLPSNCVIPTDILVTPGNDALGPLATGVCSAYLIGLDPLTYLPYVPNPTETAFGDLIPIPEGYPGFDPTEANNGQGFLKDLSGNELPNAPDFTATITADFALPLPNDWLMTLHTDLYYQSEAWTRIFNTEGYDKLKAYTNMNLAAIFLNEDTGWHVMAYIKNVLDKDNITGAFLNSDDTGLTTNVFLNEPRLYGLRVTKEWTGGPLLGSFGARRDGPYPLTAEFGGQMQRIDAPGEGIAPFADAFSENLDPRRPQQEDLDWTDGSQLKLIYRPSGWKWDARLGVRYGRTSDASGRINLAEQAGPVACSGPLTGPYAALGREACDPEYVWAKYPQISLYNARNLKTPFNRMATSVSRREEHLVVDFEIGREIGLGLPHVDGIESRVGAGVRFARFRSSVSGDMRGVPDLSMPDGWGFNGKYDTTFHQYATTFEVDRSFEGAGPVASWEAAAELWRGEGGGRLNLDGALAAGVLFGEQETRIAGTEGAEFVEMTTPLFPPDYILTALPAVTQSPMSHKPRSEDASVPVLDLSLGLSFEVQGVRLSTGYRWERYFDVLDAGFETHRSFDRTIDGPYFTIAVGFGG